MSFAAPTFLWYFMPAVLIAYWILPRTFRNALISVASLVFYAWGAGSFVVVLVACIVVNFVVGIAIDSATLASRARARKWVLIAADNFRPWDSCHMEVCRFRFASDSRNFECPWVRTQPHYFLGAAHRNLFLHFPSYVLHH